MTKQQIVEEIMDFINEEPDASKSEVEKHIKEVLEQSKLDADTKEIIKSTYNEYVVSELKYKKGKKIEKITPVLNELIKDETLEVEDNLVLLTNDNATKIINKISADDSYIPFAEIVYKKYLYDFNNDNSRIERNENKSLFAVLREIDIENSTQVWRYKYKRDNFYKLVGFITGPQNHFFDRLCNGDINLPDEIIDYSGTAVVSFASKACHCLYLFMYQNGDNKYYKNDKFIRAALPFYLDYYGVKHKFKTKVKDKISYAELHEYLDKLRDAAGEKHGRKISRIEMDQIIWYCYKSFKA